MSSSSLTVATTPDRSRATRELRSDDRLRAHYEVERELADRIRNASAASRRALYARVYDELFERVPDHPQLRRKSSRELSDSAVTAQYRLVRRFLGPSTTFLEIGPGDCALALRACRDAREVIAADVSDSITKGLASPPNFRLTLFDGCELGLPDGSVDFAYSNQVIEHLHPDDAVTQLASTWRALRPGGAYLCITPSRANGPHDVSGFFDPVATGFHLKEYTYAELEAVMVRVGFVGIRAFVGVKGHFAALPVPVLRAVEGAALRSGRRSWLEGILDRALMIRLLGWKPGGPR
jgi:SAM-dependent methyltransferase